VSILLTCTGRGSHPLRKLGWLLPELPDGRVREIVFVPWAPGRELFEGDRPTLRGTLRITPCPVQTCERTLPPIHPDDALRLYDGAVTRAFRTLDVSRL
jgi:hypothetical protein